MSSLKNPIAKNGTAPMPAATTNRRWRLRASRVISRAGWWLTRVGANAVPTFAMTMRMPMGTSSSVRRRRSKWKGSAA